MKRSEIIRNIELIRVDVQSIDDASLKQGFGTLLNLVEQLADENQKLRDENQQLRDEIDRMKGESKLPPAPRQKPNKDVSSEKERKKRETKLSGNQVSRRAFKDLQVHQEQICPVTREKLPADARLIGYDEVIVQDLVVTPRNIKFRKERFYSASLDQWFCGSLPDGYQGEYGPHLKSLIIAMKYSGNMTDSTGTISNILTRSAELFHEEKSALYRAGLQSTIYQQIDDTSATVNGKKYHTQIVCNPFYTAYFTTPRKDRLTILDVLQNFGPRRYRFDEQTNRLMGRLRVSQKLIQLLPARFMSDRDYSQNEVDEQLSTLFPDPAKGQRHRQHIEEAAAIVAYHQQQDIPVVKILVCDDAGQFKVLTDKLALCWIHEGRHYQKLNPVLPLHQKCLDAFRERFWDYYGQLVEYRQSPSAKQVGELAAEFDKLFSTVTGYDLLDERITKTQAKKDELLTVLSYPEAPLHNNESELGARVSARRRDVSLHTKSQAGTRAMDTFTTIVQTAKKLCVNAYAYIFDRISGRQQLPSLAELIEARSHGPPAMCPT
jgi:cell division protein FtsB